MRFFAFFTRTKRLSVLFAALCAVLGVVLLLAVFPYITDGGWSHIFDDLPLLGVGLGAFVTLLVAAVSLYAIAKDAAEDIGAAFHYAEKEDAKDKE